MKYRKKPVEVEALTYNGPFSIYEMAEAWGGPFRKVSLVVNGILSIYTLEGIVYPGIGDYIVKGVEGEFYPCRKSIFEASHEPVKDGGENTSEHSPKEPYEASSACLSCKAEYVFSDGFVECGCEIFVERKRA